MRKPCIIGILLAIGWTGQANAQNSYQPYVLGLRTSGMGGAATAFGQDSAMPWANPAGIGRIHVDTFSLSANAYMMETLAVNKYIALSDQAAISMGVSEDASRSTLKSSEISIFPTSLSYMLRLDDEGNHVLALSLIIPYKRIRNSTSDLIWEFGGMTFSSIDLRQENKSVYDVGPSYALRLGELTLGVSAFFRYLKIDRNWSGESMAWMLSQHYLSYSPSNSTASARSYDLDFVAGAQYGPIAGGLYFGLAAHSPSINLAGSLKANSRSYFGDTNADEHYLQYMKLEADNYESRSPMWFSFGVGYQMPEVFAVAADVSYHLPAEFTIYSGVMELLTISNDPADPSVFEGQEVEDSAELIGVFNFNVGAEVYVTDHIILRGGFFTDFCADPDLPSLNSRSHLDVGFSRINRFGGTLGVGYAGERSQFQLSLIFLGGLGDIIGWEIGETAGSYTFPNREIAWNTFMVAFSGKIDVGVIYATVKRAADEEYDRLKENGEKDE